MHVTDPSEDLVRTWALLASRLCLFASFQAVVAVGLAVGGSPAPWRASVRWWLLSALLANGVSLWLAVRELGGWAAYRARLVLRREGLRTDLAWMAGLLVLLGPVGWLPNLVLASWLWDDPATGHRLLLQPLPPVAAVVALLVFTPLHALSELPTYFVVGTPQLRARGLSSTAALLWPAFFLGLQHVALPLVFDVRFALWRAGMFLPFAVMVGLVLRARPSLLPWLVGVHLLMDAQLAVMSGLVGAGLMAI